MRFATGVLASARQLEVVTQTTAKEVDRPSAKHAPVVGSSWTDSFEGTVGVATHHDGMSGTERQDVTDDYAMRISSSQKEVEAGIGLAVSKLLKLERGAVSHCHCHAADDCLNISVCAATTGKDAFTIAAWNPLAHSVSEVARIPVSGGRWSVTDGVGRAVPSQVVPLDERTKGLPLLYLNSFGMSTRQVAEAKARLENKADHVLMVALESLPPVGLATFHAAADAESTVARAAPPPVDVAGEAAQAGEAAEAPAFAEAADTVVESDVFSLTFDGASGLLKSLTNKRSGATTALAISWGWYNSSVGEPRSECVFMCPDGYSQRGHSHPSIFGCIHLCAPSSWPVCSRGASHPNLCVLTVGWRLHRVRPRSAPLGAAASVLGPAVGRIHLSAKLVGGPRSGMRMLCPPTSAREDTHSAAFGPHCGAFAGFRSPSYSRGALKTLHTKTLHSTALPPSCRRIHHVGQHPSSPARRASRLCG